jgi:hypothetical protein
MLRAAELGKPRLTLRSASRGLSTLAVITHVLVRPWVLRGFLPHLSCSRLHGAQDNPLILYLEGPHFVQVKDG